MMDVTSQCSVEKLANGFIRIVHKPTRISGLCHRDGSPRTGDFRITASGRIVMGASIVRVHRDAR